MTSVNEVARVIMKRKNLWIRNMGKIWLPIRKLIVFQFKLYIDAFRDVLLSILSLFAVVLDIIFQTSGSDSYFEKVLVLGRRTERAINLFNHFDAKDSGANVDSIFEQVEKTVGDRMRKGEKSRSSEQE